MSKRVATILVARDSLFREGLLRILNTTPFRVAKVAATIDELSLRSIPTSPPVLFLIGVDADHAAAALTIGRLKQRSSGSRIVVLSDRCELQDPFSLFRAGADGYVVEQLTCDALIKCLDLVMIGITILPAAMMRVLGDKNGINENDRTILRTQTQAILDHNHRGLSDRETEILRCLMEGQSNKVIARQFDITEATVKAHIKAILRKISLRNRTQAAVWAHHHFLDTATIMPA